MKLVTERYADQQTRWPHTGRHILAQYDADSVVVYQAYRPDIGLFAAQHGYFGGAFSLTRMSWIKPNFLDDVPLRVGNEGTAGSDIGDPLATAGIR